VPCVSLWSVAIATEFPYWGIAQAAEDGRPVLIVVIVQAKESPSCPLGRSEVGVAGVNDVKEKCVMRVKRGSDGDMVLELLGLER